ncbi:unnamed protein product [marine sediment metagenome]|uniref:Uncharacterized protein n=1 Tax=marine sediment metagenome TaxID=412755 RepID=X0V4L8_9ZZZZ
MSHEDEIHNGLMESLKGFLTEPPEALKLKDHQREALQIMAEKGVVVMMPRHAGKAGMVHTPLPDVIIMGNGRTVTTLDFKMVVASTPDHVNQRQMQEYVLTMYDEAPHPTPIIDSEEPPTPGARAVAHLRARKGQRY